MSSSLMLHSVLSYGWTVHLKLLAALGCISLAQFSMKMGCCVFSGKRGLDVKQQARIHVTTRLKTWQEVGFKLLMSETTLNTCMTNDPCLTLNAHISPLWQISRIVNSSFIVCCVVCFYYNSMSHGQITVIICTTTDRSLWVSAGLGGLLLTCNPIQLATCWKMISNPIQISQYERNVIWLLSITFELLQKQICN